MKKLTFTLILFISATLSSKAQKISLATSSISYSKLFGQYFIDNSWSKKVPIANEFTISLDSYVELRKFNIHKYELGVNYGLSITHFGGFNNRSIYERGNSGWIVNPTLNANFNLFENRKLSVNIISTSKFLLNKKALDKRNDNLNYSWLNFSYGIHLLLPRYSNKLGVIINNSINPIKYKDNLNNIGGQKYFWTSIGINYSWDSPKKQSLQEKVIMHF